MRTALRAFVPSFLVLALATSTAVAAPPLVLTGSPTAAGDPVVRAREALVARAPELAGRTLDHLETVKLPDGRKVVRFRESRGGVPVAYAGASVVVRADGGATPLALTRVSSHVREAAPKLTRDEAALRVAERVGVAVPSERGRLVYWESGGEHVLAWAFYAGFVVAPSPMAPVVVVDASDGTVLAAWDALLSAGKAKVHLRNPVTTPDLTDVTLSVTPDAKIPENALVKAQNCIDEKKTKMINVGINLTVHSCELQNKALADASGDFTAYLPTSDTDPEDAFAEVDMFHHTTQAYDFFMGLGMPELMTKPLPAVVNLRVPQGLTSFDIAKIGDPNLPLQPQDNAFFSPSNPIFGEVFGIDGAAMFFFQGTKADFGYDGDVVYHEFGHAMVDRTIQLVGTWWRDEQGARPAAGAMNEGLADFFSSALAGDPNVGEYASKSLTQGQPAIRVIDNQDDCLLDVSGEVHADSTFFSGALWSVRKGLAAADQTEFDKALLAGLIMAPSGNVGYEELASIFTASLEAAGHKPFADALVAELAKRGQGSVCKRIREWEGKPINGRSASLANSFFTAGRQSVPGAAKAAYAPGLFQVHAKVTGAQLTVSFLQVQTSSGGSNPLGGGGTPFKPLVLVKFGKDPIAFEYAGGVTSNAGDPIATTAKGSSVTTAPIDVPAGETEVHVMVVNGGDQDGAYRTLALGFMGDPPAGTGGAAGAGGSDAGGAAGTGTSAPAASPKSEDDGGCGCVVAGGPVGLFGTGSLALVAMAALARRRGAKVARRRGAE